MSTTSAGTGAPGALRRVLWPAAVVLVLVAAVAVHVVRPSTLWVAVAFIGTLSARPRCARGSRRSGRRLPRRLPAMLVAAGLTTNALGEVAWYTVVIGSESTDVSLADVGWVVSYFFLGAALWISLVQSREGERFDLESVIDALTIVAVSVLTLWNFSVAQIAGDPSLTPLDQAGVVDLPDHGRDPDRAGHPDRDRPTRARRHRPVVRGRGRRLAGGRHRLPDPPADGLPRELGERRLDDRRHPDGALPPRRAGPCRRPAASPRSGGSASWPSPSARCAVVVLLADPRPADGAPAPPVGTDRRRRPAARAGRGPDGAAAVVGAARDPRAQRRARRRAAGVAGEVGVPGHDEPRDPDPDERRARTLRPAAAHRPRRAAALVRRGGARRRREPPGADQRHPRLLQGRGRPARARGRSTSTWSRWSRAPPRSWRARPTARAWSC